MVRFVVKAYSEVKMLNELLILTGSHHCVHENKDRAAESSRSSPEPKSETEPSRTAQPPPLDAAFLPSALALVQR